MYHILQQETGSPIIFNPQMVAMATEPPQLQNMKTIILFKIVLALLSGNWTVSHIVS